MAKESAVKFVQAVMDNEELRQRTGAMKPEELIPFAKETGYDFTLEELKEVKKEDIELSPEELEAVAGGNINTNQAIARAQGDREREEKARHCNHDLLAPLHNWVKIGHKEEPVLGGLLSWMSDWSNGYDLRKCTLCGEEQWFND